MSDDYSQFEQRKQDHIDLALMPANQTGELNPFDHVSLMHDALPDFNFHDLDIKSTRFGKTVATPFIVSSMTAGHRDAANINRHLMAAATQCGWAMGVGSQRRELTDHSASAEWQPLRTEFPNVSLFSNVGIAQLITTQHDAIRRLVDVIQADGLIIHCNPLQECIQPEGTPSFKGCWHALADLVKHISVPVIVKETGCGFSEATLQRLNDIGIAAIDVSGLGGTHWGRIEGHRAANQSMQQRASQTFRNWGIDTVSSVIQASALNGSAEIWGSGGVRHGLDAAKLIALGTSTVGFAKPLLQAALISIEDVVAEMNTIEYELKVAMFCTGSRALHDLKNALCV